MNRFVFARYTVGRAIPGGATFPDDRRSEEENQVASISLFLANKENRRRLRGATCRAPAPGVRAFLESAARTEETMQRGVVYSRYELPLRSTPNIHTHKQVAHALTAARYSSLSRLFFLRLVHYPLRLLPRFTTTRKAGDK